MVKSQYESEAQRRPGRARPTLAGLLRGPVRAADEHSGQALRWAGFGDIGTAHQTVLEHLAADGSRLIELARLAGSTKQAMNHLVNDLEASGYVERAPDPTDGRAKLIRLTDHGREADRVRRQALTTLEKRWRKLVGRDELEACMATLLRLREAVRDESGPGTTAD